MESNYLYTKIRKMHRLKSIFLEDKKTNEITHQNQLSPEFNENIAWHLSQVQVKVFRLYTLEVLNFILKILAPIKKADYV